MEKNRLYYGDNVKVLPKLPDCSVDMIYLDPPFNSKRNYSVIFSRSAREEDADTAQIQAFEDTWHWTPTTDEQFSAFIDSAPMEAGDAITAFHTLLGENDAMAYLVNMAPRLLELHRVLKETGTIFLHCDPTMSHYLKILMDAIFGPENFQNEIVWRYQTGGVSKKRFGRKHDIILFYSKSGKFKYYPDRIMVSRTEEVIRRIQSGVAGATRATTLEKLPDDVFEIQALNAMAKERLGYPTQKPIALLGRIIRAVTDEGDVVLDPFCGCGTTVDAAQRLNRKWIGIDISYFAVDLIIKRLKDVYRDQQPPIEETFTVSGVPQDVEAAQKLFEDSHFEFERWAVSLIGAQPKAKPGGDKGIDGVARFVLPGGSTNRGKIIVSVKGGSYGPTDVRDLDGVLRRDRADIGILITLRPATRGVKDAINHGGTYKHPAIAQPFNRLQHMTIAELLEGKQPNVPFMDTETHIQAEALPPEDAQTELF